MTTDVRPLKPDGWHTYHICGGVLRELTFLGRAGVLSEAMCPNCGEWYRGTVTAPIPLAVEADSRKRARG